VDNVDQDVRMLLHSLEELILQRPQRLCLKTRRCRSLAHAIAYMHETALHGYYSTRCMRARKRDRRGHLFARRAVRLQRDRAARLPYFMRAPQSAYRGSTH
jgi:hypothetical protein